MNIARPISDRPPSGRASRGLSTVWGTSGGARTAPPDPTKLRASRLGLRLLGFPDTDVARLRHDEQTDDETHRRNHDGANKSIPAAPARQKSGGGDERHEAPAPALRVVVGHR